MCPPLAAFTVVYMFLFFLILLTLVCASRTKKLPSGLPNNTFLASSRVMLPQYQGAARSSSFLGSCTGACGLIVEQCIGEGSTAETTTATQEKREKTYSERRNHILHQLQCCFKYTYIHTCMHAYKQMYVSKCLHTHICSMGVAYV